MLEVAAARLVKVSATWIQIFSEEILAPQRGSRISLVEWTLYTERQGKTLERVRLLWSFDVSASQSTTSFLSMSIFQALKSADISQTR